MTTTWQIDTLDNGLARRHHAHADRAVGKRLHLRRRRLANGGAAHQRHLPLPGAHALQGHHEAADRPRHLRGHRRRWRRSQRLHQQGVHRLLGPRPLRPHGPRRRRARRHGPRPAPRRARRSTASGRSCSRRSRRAHDQPGAWASELLSRACYGDQPIGWPIAGHGGDRRGDPARGLRRPHGEVVRARDHVSSRVAGNTTPEQVVALDRSADRRGSRGRPVPSFAPRRRGCRRARPGRSRATSTSATSSSACAPSPAQTPTATRSPSSTAVLGRGMSSRLFKEVRERRGLAYSVGSSVSRHHDTGVMAISAGVSPEKVEEARQGHPGGGLQAGRRAGARGRADARPRLHRRQLPPRPGDDDGA